MATKKILVVLTSHDKLGESGKKTGWYLPELAHPYDVFTDAGYEVTLASPKGGVAPLDQSSVEAFKDDASSANFLSKHSALWENTEPLSAVAGRVGDFDAIFYPGGHGPMFDLINDAASQKLIADFWGAGKPVAAVCHGPIALANVKLPDGSLLVRGKKVTIFSNAEEIAADMARWMPVMPETKLNEASGGGFEKADELFAEKVVVDGLLITGQNPASAKGVGEALVKALKG